LVSCLLVQAKARKVGPPMRKKTIGILLILSTVMFIVGIILFVLVIVGSPSVYNPSTGSNEITSISNLPLFITSIVLYVLALVTFFIGWIGALINLARLREWTWFVLTLLFSFVCVIVYLFAGPEAAPTLKYPQMYEMPPEHYQL
jgi:drug/metabolite transporter (DMT)-like permease